MRYTLLLLVCLVLTMPCFLLGCGDTSSEEQETIVKPMEDYREEANKKITAENADEELDKLVEEINSDKPE